MATKRRKRDSRYSRSIGAKPYVGRRYVENGRVRIEWTVDGKRRSRTIGSNSADTRRRADAELEAILEQLHSAREAELPLRDSRPTIERALRSQAAFLLDVADHLADWIREALGLERGH